MSARPLARLAWRDVRRRPLRTVLVSLLIAVPFAGMLAINVAIANSGPHVEFEMGRANAIVSMYSDGITPVQPSPLTPDDVVIEDRRIPVEVDGRLRAVTVTVGALDAPLLRGKYDYRDGRAPTSADEVAVSEGWRRKHDVTVGDSLVFGSPGVPLRVVGVFVDRSQLQTAGLQLASTELGYTTSWTLYSAAGKAEVLESANAANIAVQFRDDPEARLPPEVRFAVHSASIVALMAIALLIAAAFASGARRQLREVGLISANGANPRHVRTAFSLQGTITGLVGVTIGSALFAVVVLVAGSRVRWLVGSDVPVRFSVPDLVVSLASIIGASTLAAWWSARSVARTPVLAALSGRKPLPRTPAAVPVVGVALAVIGVLLVGQGAKSTSTGGTLGGAALLVIAVALSSSWMVSALGGAAARTGGVLRIVGRAVARQRTRTGPLVAAMAVIGALGVLTMVATESEAEAADLQYLIGNNAVSMFWDGAPSQDAIRADLDEVSRIVPDATQLVSVPPTDTALADGDTYLDVTGAAAGADYVNVVFVDTELSSMPEAATAMLRSGRAVLVGIDASSVEIRATLISDESATSQHLGTMMVPATASDELTLVNDIYGETPTALVDKSAIAKLGLDVDPSASAGIVKAEALTQAERDSLSAFSRERSEQTELQRAIAGDVSASPGLSMSVGFDTAGERSVMRWMMIAALGVVAVLLMAAVGFGMSLSRIEQRDDEALLEALGAPPGFRRRAAAIEAAMLCAMAMLVAAPLGIVTGVVIRRSISEFDVAVPIVPIAALALGLPLVCGLAFGGLQRGHRGVQLTS